MGRDNKMLCKSKFNVLLHLFYLVSFLTQLVHNSAVEHNCIVSSKTKFICNNYIPTDIVDTIKDVHVININQKETHIGIESFTGKGWSQVERLELMAVDNISLGSTHLSNNTFSSLFSLRVLLLSLPVLMSVEEGAFIGLNNLIELDLTGCIRTSVFYLLLVLQNDKSMPNLNFLKTDRLNEMAKLPLYNNNFDENFFKILHIRNITKFYARRMFINTFDTNAFILMCDTLKEFDVSHTFFSHFVPTKSPCKSLRRLSLNSINSQMKWESLNYENLYLSMKLHERFYLFESVVKLQFDYFFTNVSIIKNVRLDILSLKEFNFREISIQNNSFRHLDVVFTADLIFKKLEKLEMQGNTLEYMNGGAFKSMSSLNTLNLSNNRLGVMQRSHPFDFENLFRYLYSVKVVDLSNNGLAFLPRNTFKNNNHLSILYLSNNRLEQFALSSTFSLSLVDLKRNAITHLDQRSRQWFNEKFKSKNTDSHFFADMHGNPLQCLCKYQTFLDWIVQTPLVGNSSHAMTCSDHDHDELTVPFTERLREECERTIRLVNISIVSSAVVFTVLISTFTTIAVYKHRRRKLRQKRTREEIVAQIQDNIYHLQYPVFLSYSNEDVDFVMEYVYQDLIGCLRQMFDTPRDLVCIGDRHFRPGRTIFDEIDYCLNISAIIICVVSRHFCQSNFCRYELEQAYVLKKPIMLLLIEEVDEEDMPLLIRQHFNKYARISLRFHDGELIITPTWERVCESILDLLPKLMT